MSKKETGGALRRMMAYALLVALGVVFSRLLAIDAGVLRFNLGAVPVLLAGLIFGPLGGAVVGALADAIGGLLVGYTLNPFITLGAASIGFVCGLLWRRLPVKNDRVRLALSVAGGHLVGSLCIVTLTLHWFYGYAWAALVPRIPTYLILSAVETAVLWLLLHNAGLRDAVNRLK